MNTGVDTIFLLPMLIRSVKILVTGGGGFLGGHIINLLQKRGYKVRAVGRREQPGLVALGVEFVQGDISFKDNAYAAVKGVDAVFHVAGRAQMDFDYRAYYNTNVVGTKNIVKACLFYDVPKLIYTSTPAVVFNGKNLAGCDESLPYQKYYHWYYTQTKAMAEEYVLKHNSKNLKTVAIRPHLMLGQGDPHFIPNILRCLRNKTLKKIGSGKNLVDITFIENAAYAHLLAFDALDTGVACGKAYFIGQEKPINLWNLINTILKCLNFPIVTKKMTFHRAYLSGLFIESWYKIFCRSGIPPMTRALAIALSKDHYFSHERARKDLDYTPQITIEQGLESLINVLRLQMKILETSSHVLR
ncbi:MAG: NAD-dependent epimerase/dehydratase family protein [Puniceicoccales bacterium]|jgi:nucleoside-diphosphate-sugar epimerase|nr:NAD-dependent epimerase/dehydratase family protein [Puniceicoccales bacterium]